MVRVGGLNISGPGTSGNSTCYKAFASGCSAPTSWAVKKKFLAIKKNGGTLRVNLAGSDTVAYKVAATSSKRHLQLDLLWQITLTEDE
jgi:hypothetical protein